MMSIAMNTTGQAIRNDLTHNPGNCRFQGRNISDITPDTMDEVKNDMINANKRFL